MSKQQKFIIIDGNALLHRAFHALPPMTLKDGTLVNAVYGFTLILLKIIKDLRPDYLCAAFDRAGKTKRAEEFAEYKAQRVKQPDELYQQIPIIENILDAFNIPVIDSREEGYEADDVIGTVVTKLKKDEPEIKSIIVTGDLDTLQLVDEYTEVFTLKKGISDTIIYAPQTVKERYGLTPEQLIDFKALRGDPSDNIPGVKGIGEKTATELLQTFGTLENL
jgi:DNA polymerase-1